MTRLAAVLALMAIPSALSSPALAQGRPSSTAMTCAAASAFVKARGAVVIGTGGDTFDRAVRDVSFCPPFSNTRPLFAPTRDNPQCLIGERCFDEPLDPN